MGLVALAIFVSGCIGGSDVVNDTIGGPSSTIGGSSSSTLSGVVDTGPIIAQGADDVAFDQFLDKYKQKRLFLNGNTIPDRGGYGVNTRIFALLPTVPNDFLYKVYLMKYGRFVDIGTLGPEYYKQPEFDPDFSRFGLRYWKEWANANYSKKQWGTIGFRTYPFSQHILAAPGNSFNLTLFLSTDWNVETYQGVHLEPTFIENAVTEDGKSIKASVDGAKYINVNVTPNEFLMTPAFPQFTEDWVRKLSFVGKISNDTPKGVYIVSFKMSAPSQANADKWLLEYLNLYSESSNMVIADKPMLQAFIYVN